MDRIWLSTQSKLQRLPMRPEINERKPSDPPPSQSPWRWREGIPIMSAGPRETYIGDHRIPLGLSTAEAKWLTSIQGNRSSRRSACPTGDVRAQVVLEHVRAVGAIAWQAECWWLAPPDRARMQSHLLSLSEWHSDPETAVAARTTWRIGVHGHDSVATVVTRLLDASGLVCAPAREADIVVLVGAHGVDAPEVLLPLDDPGLLDLPHLPVSVYRAHASIGPLVVPGRTPCLNCLHLQRCDTEPEWPHLVDQWRAAASAMAGDADPLLASHAAVSAVAMVRHWIDTARATTAYRIRWRFPDPMPRSDVLTHHPSCGCRWGASDR